MCSETILVPIPAFLRPYVPMPLPDHPEYGIDDRGRECLNLDACVVPALTALWNNGIPTLSACCLHGAGFGTITLPRVMLPGEAADPDDLIPTWRWQERAFDAEATSAHQAARIEALTKALDGLSGPAEDGGRCWCMDYRWDDMHGDECLATRAALAAAPQPASVAHQAAAIERLTKALEESHRYALCVVGASEAYGETESAHLWNEIAAIAEAGLRPLAAAPQPADGRD